jgi:hypothetical protein
MTGAERMAKHRAARRAARAADRAAAPSMTASDFFAAVPTSVSTTKRRRA